MAMIVKPVIHLHTQIFSLGIILGKLGQDIDLQFSCLSVLLDILDNFDGKNFVFLKILTLDNLAKCSLTELSVYFVPIQELGYIG